MPLEVREVRDKYDPMQMALFFSEEPLDKDKLRETVVAVDSTVGFEIVDAVIIAGINDGVIQDEFVPDRHKLSFIL